MNSNNDLKSIKSDDKTSKLKDDSVHQAEKKSTLKSTPTPPDVLDDTPDELISKKVIVSVKKFVENTENDELTVSK